MSSEAIFDGAPEHGTINFSVGQPSADLLPLALLSTAGARFFANAEPLELNYGQRQGDVRFRTALAHFLGKSAGSPVDPDSLMLTSGISQALDFVCGRFTRPGDVVFVEEPSYPYSFPIFRDHGLEILGVRVDGAGVDVDVLERELAKRRPKLVYTIPAFHNPTGQVLDRVRRERLISLSREHGFIIVADEAYQLLHHGTPPPPSFGALGGDGNVLSLGTFSKILAPGLRLGWIQTTPDLMTTLLASGALVSGGNFNHFTFARRAPAHGKRRAFSSRDGPARELCGARTGDGHGTQETLQQHRALAETGRRLLLRARARGRRRGRRARGGGSRRRDRFPARHRLFDFGRPPALPAPVLRALQRA